MQVVDEIVAEFLVESLENLDQLDQDLVALERDPGSRELLSSIFRTVHTIKGTSSFFAFGTLESVAHVGESILSRLRAGELTLSAQITTLLLEMVDAIRSLLASIEESGSEGDGDYSELVGRLQAVVDGTPAVPLDPPSADGGADAGANVPLLGQLLVERGLAVRDLTLALTGQDVGDKRPLGEILVADGFVTRDDLSDALNAQAGGHHSVGDNSIRVDVNLLDKLMNLVGELVLTRNQLLAQAATRQDAELQQTAQRLNLIAGELHQGVMKTRMQSIDNGWSKLPKVVRGLCVSLGKSVRVEMEGRDTELDKTVLEAVKDPMTHLVRNAVDHGVEEPSLRVAAGKPAEGLLLLRAFRAGGKVNIEITDDGAGIDPAMLRDEAVSAGMLARDAADQLTDRQTLDLVFAPGFSTAATVTSVSGRGVGMDVAKTNIEKIGGSVDIVSVLGQGTTVRIQIPLTLAIIPALVICAAGNLYAIPQVDVLELVRLEREQSLARIQTVRGTPVYRLHGAPLPLVDLRAQLGAPSMENETTFIVVLQADGRQYGLVVDQVKDTEEVVVKPLGRLLRDAPLLYSGATIMGDGRIALILDAAELAKQAGISDTTAAAGSTSQAADELARTASNLHQLVGQFAY